MSLLAIVCEHAEATWLPFQPFTTVRTAQTGRRATTPEGVYVQRR